jgi:trimethylamine--corrinoid protein Co-methyltransferase
MEALRPKIALLRDELREKILREALQLLEAEGVFVESREALTLLREAGASVDDEAMKARIGEGLVRKALESAPKKIAVYDREGRPVLNLSGDRVHFNPGSAALRILDGETGRRRRPTSHDYVRFTRLTDALENMDAQSTALIPCDIPDVFADRYRLYIALLYSSKPVITGTFALDAFEPMRELLLAIRGGESQLREKPLAVFDCAPSPPLRWSELTCQCLVDCARCGIPAELVSMPMAGATSPVSLSGTLVVHTAESLSGVVISQLAAAGAPVIYGGSPSVMDMRRGTTPMGAIETMMIDSAFCQIGKSLGLPTHAYMGLSDSKCADAQAGIESTLGTLIAALSGVNVVSGPGMLDFESCQSMEKLLMDNEICGMVRRFLRGIAQRDEPMALSIMPDFSKSGQLLTHPSTIRWFREELFMPRSIIDRCDGVEWEKRGRSSAWDRARKEVTAILEKYEVEPLDEARAGALRDVIAKEARRLGVEDLPVL